MLVKGLNNELFLIAASDDCINIWRINIKDSGETIECECSYEYVYRNVDYFQEKV